MKYLNCLNENIILLGKCVFHYYWPTEGSLSCSIPPNYFEQCEFLYNAVKAEIDLLAMGGRVNFRLFYTDCFNEYQKGILAVFRSKKKLKDKIALVNKVMASVTYQTCAQHAVISPNKIYCKLSRAKNCYGLLAWFFLAYKEEI